METLFNLAPTTANQPGVGPRSTINANNAYILATILRALQYADQTYIHGLKAAIGAGSVVIQRNVDGYPPPYAVFYHTDGVLVAFAGLQNVQQFGTLYGNSHLESIYPNAANQRQVFGLAAELNRAHRENVFALIDAAPNKTRVVVCGHSMGGPLAAILAEQIKVRYTPTTLAYSMTFGSPKAGDEAFARSGDYRAFNVNTPDDPVPGFPLWTSRYTPGFNLPIGHAIPEAYGVPWQINANGVFEPWNGSHGWTTPGVVARAVTFSADVLPQHSLDSYTEMLARAVLRGPATEWTDECRFFNRHMTNGTNPVVPGGVIAPPPSDPIPDNKSRALAEVQRRQTAPDTVLAPPTPVYDSSFVGQGNQAIVSARVSSSPDPTATFVFKDEDYRKMRNLRASLAALVHRDASLAIRRPTARLSNFEPMIDQTDLTEIDAVLLLMSRLDDCLALEE